MHHTPEHLPIKNRAAEAGGTSLSETFWKGFLEVAIYPVGAASFLLSLPQVYSVWMLHETAGISLITWSTWAASSVFWFLYGLVHRATAVVIMQVLWFFFYLAIISGVLLYS